jgi:hypothetical protein
LKLDLLFPEAGSVSVEELIDDLVTVPDEAPLEVGDERLRSFLADFARRLLRPELTRRYPELGSLGFFLRPAEVERTLAHLTDSGPDRRRAPRGMVLHFPPANVGTIFAYSWALSALGGNSNVVRISARSGNAGQAVLQALRAALADADPVIARTQRIVAFEHDDATTARLSAACDLRVIWGGDAAVHAIRRHRLQPHARDLTFPDRSSFAVISVAAWDAADPSERRDAVERFSTDVYWFDQAACSSPRVLCWVGDAERADSGRAEFSTVLSEVLGERGWSVDSSMAVEKQVASYGLAASGAATKVAFVGNAITNVELRGVEAWQRDWLGAGTVCHVTVRGLDDLVPVIERKDQTITHFGFAKSELDKLLRLAAHRGIDRVVPFGRALTFTSVWDGYDLAREFTRLVTLQT